MDHTMGMEVTEDDSAWAEVAGAKRNLEDMLAKCQPGRPLLDGPMIRGMIGLALAHLEMAQELHSAHSHTHTITIPPMAVRVDVGETITVAGGIIGVEEAIRQGLIQVVTKKGEDGP
jgi:hypothetical protein